MVLYKVIADVSNVEKYSFSKLSTIHQCPYMYDLYYNQKIEGENNGMAQCGSLVHSILERYFKRELLQFELVDTFLDEFDEKVPNGVTLTFSSGFEKDMTEKYKEQCIDFLSNFQTIENLDVVSIEENFNLLTMIKDKTIILNGFIDIIAKDKENNFYVIDWKSKSKFKNKAEIKEYARQLYLYSIYVKHKFGKYPKEIWFYQFRIGHIEKIIFNEMDFEEALDWAYDTVKQIENEQFFLPIDFSKYETPTALNDAKFFCANLCDYSKICDYWR